MTSNSHNFEIFGEKFNLKPRRMRGALIKGRHPWRSHGAMVQAPAVQAPAALLILVIVIPAARTLGNSGTRWIVVVWSLCFLLVLFVALQLVQFLLRLPWNRLRGAASEADSERVQSLRSEPDPKPYGFMAAVAGLSIVLLAVYFLRWIAARYPNASVVPESIDSLWRTLVWVGLGFAVLVFAFFVAWWTRSCSLSRPVMLCLIAPFAVSGLAAGVAFRAIRDIIVDGGVACNLSWALKVALILMLGLAFVWMWLGVVVVLLHTALRAVMGDSIRRNYLELGADGWRRIGRAAALLGPVVLIAGLVITVAAARVFDLVLIGVPASMQKDWDNGTVYWWRIATGLDAPPDVAAYTLPTTTVVLCLALILHTVARRARVTLPPEDTAPLGESRPSMFRRCLLPLLSAITLIPWAFLCYCALHPPYTSLWELSGDSLKRMLTSLLLWHAVETTGMVALGATFIVLTASLPVSYRLAAPSRPRITEFAVMTTVAFAVLPVQVYLSSIRHWIREMGVAAAPIPMILVHAAAGLPMAVLILRNSLLAVRSDPAAADELYGLATAKTVLRRLIRSVGPAFVAVAVLEFVQVWNDFVVSLITVGPGGSALSLLLWGEARQFSYNASDFASGAVITILVPLALMLGTWRRWVLPGITAGQMT